ncbi:DUF6264 family protein [Microbacterium sp. NPDC019599]|uniref:DUF6264 family protein n=1 Tax=Microbacterium sp. NPDC019599 TaxID=3154690 RepID=UPI0033C01C70
MTTPPPVPPAGQPSYGEPAPAQPSGYPGSAAQPGPPVAGAPYAPPPARPPRQPVQLWDVILTIVLLVGLVFVTAFASFAGVFLVMASDSCGAVGECNSGLIVMGWLVGMLLPWVVLIATVTVAVVFMVKRKLAFYLPLIGAVAVGGALVLGFALAGAGVPAS